MSGVDRFDQFTSYYQIDIRSKNPYFRMIFHLLEVVTKNSHTLYNRYIEKNKKYLDFRMKLI